MTTTELTNTNASDPTTAIPAPDLLTDLVDPILTHLVRHWWHTQHDLLSTPDDPRPVIPDLPFHFLDVVPQKLAPSVLPTIFAPYVTVSSPWTVPNQRVADQASALGWVPALDALITLKQQGGFKCPLLYTARTLDDASTNGHVAVLDWWLALHRQDPKRYPLKYTEHALDTASWNGNMPVLNWWLASGLELRHSWAALADASEAGRVDVLEWWLEAELAGRVVRDVSARVLDRASGQNHVAVLDWWMDNGKLDSIEGKYSPQTVITAAARGHLDVLKWWKARIAAGQVDDDMWESAEVIKKAARFGRIDVLDWLLEEGQCTEEIREEVSEAGWEEWQEWKQEGKDWWKEKFGRWVLWK